MRPLLMFLLLLPLLAMGQSVSPLSEELDFLEASRIVKDVWMLSTNSKNLVGAENFSILSSSNANNLFYSAYTTGDSAGHHVSFSSNSFGNVILAKTIPSSLLADSARLWLRIPSWASEPVRVAIAVDSAGNKLITTSFVYGTTKEGQTTVPFLSRSFGANQVDRLLVAISNMNSNPQLVALILRGIDLRVGGTWVRLDSIGMIGGSIIVPTVALIEPQNGGVNVSYLNTRFSCFPAIVDSYNFYVSIQGYPDPVVIKSSAPQITFSLPPQKFVQWYVRAVISGVEGPPSPTWSFTTSSTLTEVEKNNLRPEVFGLAQNYPNPFNPTTNISFSLAQAGYTELRVYDLLGREVKVLVNSELMAGLHQVNFDAVDLSSGVYVYRLTSGKQSQVRRMVLQR